MRAITTRLSSHEIKQYIWKNSIRYALKQDLSHCIRRIRRILGDRAANPQFIETAPGIGYRFVGTVVRAGKQLCVSDGVADPAASAGNKDVKSPLDCDKAIGYFGQSAVAIFSWALARLQSRVDAELMPC